MTSTKSFLLLMTIIIGSMVYVSVKTYNNITKLNTKINNMKTIK